MTPVAGRFGGFNMKPIDLIRDWDFPEDEAQHAVAVGVLADCMSDHGFDEWERYLRQIQKGDAGLVRWEYGQRFWKGLLLSPPNFGNWPIETHTNVQFGVAHGGMELARLEASQWGPLLPMVGKRLVRESARRTVEEAWHSAAGSAGRVEAPYGPLIGLGWPGEGKPYVTDGFGNGWRLYRVLRMSDIERKTHQWNVFWNEALHRVSGSTIEGVARSVASVGWHLTYKAAESLLVAGVPA